MKLKIPELLEKNNIRIFGESAGNWTIDLPNIIQKCLIKWELNNLEILADSTVNLICFCDSEVFGKSVLKICFPNPELYSEITALQQFKSKNICQLYDSDLELGAFLLERIIPGTDLTSIHDNDERFSIAAKLITELPVTFNKNPRLPLYSNWVSKAFSNTIDKNYSVLNPIIEIAREHFFQIENKFSERKILHGDLHHKNILQDKNGNWKAIDPKGVIGIPFLETGRFIKNQLEMVKAAERQDNLEKMITVFSKKMSVSKNDIYSCALVDSVLSTCWSIEDKESSESISNSIKICEFILDNNIF